VKILITAFEPFGNSSVNASEQVLGLLARQQVTGIHLHTALLPVDKEDAPSLLLQRLDEVDPQAVICLGEAAHRTALSLERIAINLLDYRIPDNMGCLVVDEPISPAGPAAYFSTLPLRELLASIRAVGVPAELSLSAGTYLCNQVFYTMLHHLAQQGSTIPAGFIHLPVLPAAAALAHPPLPSLPAETSLQGLLAALSCFVVPNAAGQSP
jgi:pyroglutamyl-peptidase